MVKFFSKSVFGIDNPIYSMYNAIVHTINGHLLKPNAAHLRHIFFAQKPPLFLPVPLVRDSEKRVLLV